MKTYYNHRTYFIMVIGLKTSKNLTKKTQRLCEDIIIMSPKKVGFGLATFTAREGAISQEHCKCFHAQKTSHPARDA